MPRTGAAIGTFSASFCSNATRLNTTMMIRFVFLFCSMMILAVAGVRSQSAKGRGKATRDPVQYGTASYYADKFEGRRTANGEIFHQDRLTAAHNALPLGTWIRVTNTRNNKSVIVKVNDRLHPRNSRLVDLSKAAARQLGYLRGGLARVKVEVLGKKKP
jgi:rare lipoprotein A